MKYVVIVILIAVVMVGSFVRGFLDGEEDRMKNRPRKSCLDCKHCKAVVYYRSGKKIHFCDKPNADGEYEVVYGVYSCKAFEKEEKK